MAYQFKQVGGNIQVSDDKGAIIGTGTSDWAKTNYGYQAPAPQTPVQPVQSPFGISAGPVLDRSAQAAAAAAQTTLGNPATYSYTDTTGKKITTSTPPNFQFQGNTYNYSQLPDGFTSQKPTNQSYLEIPTPFGPVYKLTGQPAQSGQPSGIPQGYSQSTDSNGNVTITDSAGRQILQAPAGTNVTSIINNVEAIHSQLPQGFSIQASPDGNVEILDQSGTSIARLGAEAAADPQSRASVLQEVSSYQQTVKANQDAVNSQLQALKSQYDQQLKQLKIQRDSALGAAGAAIGMAPPGSAQGTYQASINSRFDDLEQQLLDSYNSAVSSAQSGAESANAKAGSDLASAIDGINSGAQQNVLAQSRFQQTILQQAQQDFLNTAKTFDISATSLPTGKTIDSLTVDSTGKTGIASVDALIAQGTKAGYTAQQSLALIQSGVLAQNKANQTQWINNLKNFQLPDMSKMSLADAKKDPFLGALITQGAQVMGSEDAAFGAMQSGTLFQLQQEKIQADTARAQIEAALAPERVALMQLNAATNNATKITTEAFKQGQWGANLQSVATWMPNIDAAYNQLKKGNYTAVVTYLDAINKLNTGGQAIRQGQTMLQSDAATLTDQLNQLMVKYGVKNPGFSYGTDGQVHGGGSVQLSGKQIDLMYQDVKNVASEKVKANMPAYTAYKNGINNLKTQFPEQALPIDAAASALSNIDQFMNDYGDQLGTSGSAGSVYNGITLPN